MIIFASEYSIKKPAIWVGALAGLLTNTNTISMEQIYANYFSFCKSQPRFADHYEPVWKFKPSRSYIYNEVNRLSLPAIKIYALIIAYLPRHNDKTRPSMDAIITDSLFINLTPKLCGVLKQHIRMYLQELCDANIIMPMPGRGYWHMVNPHYHNTLSAAVVAHFNRGFKQWQAAQRVLPYAWLV